PVVSPRNSVITGKPAIWLSFISIMGMCDPSAYFVDHHLISIGLHLSLIPKVRCGAAKRKKRYPSTRSLFLLIKREKD
ncbi:MAG: hypothetical protein LBG24_08240, partial [Treponema sp.]|nr:hypothetical protein [Treponema sp.]